MACWVALLLLLLPIALAEEKAVYCQHRWASNTFYETATGPNAVDANVLVSPISVNGRDSPSDLLIADRTANAEKTSISKSLVSGIFDKSLDKDISTQTFCIAAGDVIHAADVDGDHYDDLLCQKGSDGSFTVRYFKDDDDFMPETVYAKSFRCAVGASIQQLLIGDIDGDGAEDLMCVNKGATNADHTLIYFSRSCHSQAHYHRHGYHRGYHRKASMWHEGKSVTSCRSKPGSVHSLPPGALPGCNPTADTLIMADSNGDGRSDIACHRGAGPPDVHVYRSMGEKRSVIFSRKIMTVDGCAFATMEIIGADLDGDGDDDLICGTNDAATAGHLKIAYFEHDNYGTGFDDTDTMACSTSQFCSGSAAAVGHVTYFAGDFNKDGREDLMCRFFNDDAAIPFVSTAIVFSELYDA